MVGTKGEEENPKKSGGIIFGKQFPKLFITAVFAHLANASE